MPITISDLAAFLQLVVTAFKDPLFLMITMIIAFALAYHVKGLFLSGL